MELQTGVEVVVVFCENYVVLVHVVVPVLQLEEDIPEVQVQAEVLPLHLDEEHLVANQVQVVHVLHS